MDLVEVNPLLGASREAVEATASLAVDVIASSLGQTREGAHTSIDVIPAVKDDTEQLCLWEHLKKKKNFINIIPDHSTDWTNH